MGPTKSSRSLGKLLTNDFAIVHCQITLPVDFSFFSIAVENREQCDYGETWENY